MVGEHVHDLRLPYHGAQPNALRAAGGKTVRQACGKIEARTPIHRDHLDAARGTSLDAAHVNGAAKPMLEHIGGQLRGNQRHAPAIGFIKAYFCRQLLRGTACLPHLRAFVDGDGMPKASMQGQFHLTIVTRVPSPGALWISN